MIDVHFVILGAALSALGSIFYVRATLAGQAKPDRITWLLWTVAPLLAFAVEIRSGVGLRSLMTLMVAVSPAAIFAASFANPQASWRLGPLDYLCGGLAAAGILAWLVTRHGTVALVASIASDALAALPTLVKSWQAPASESLGSHLGSLANAAITLLTVKEPTSANLAFPVYIAVLSSIEVALVGGRLGPRWRQSQARRRRESGSAGPVDRRSVG